ncbi:hypothetical protein ANN_07071 [Periplaneta americana]|uniref:Uncharacterized protein n=1 Tax=Periplaneta americana TaxID=6978 RepID=A0ABQ8TFH9_PERAM|nr:hypothetical protein ANN_07071 [Periplaneta americana]
MTTSNTEVSGLPWICGHSSLVVALCTVDSPLDSWSYDMIMFNGVANRFLVWYLGNERTKMANDTTYLDFIKPSLPKTIRVTECALVRVLMGKKFPREISASVWDRCPPSIVMHLGRYDRQRNPVANTSYNGWGDHRANHTIPPFWLDDRPPLLRHSHVERLVLDYNTAEKCQSRSHADATITS